MNLLQKLQKKVKCYGHKILYFKGKSVNVIDNLQILIYFFSGARKCNANHIHEAIKSFPICCMQTITPFTTTFCSNM